MRRWILLGLLVGGGALSLAFAATEQQAGGAGSQQSAPRVVEVDKVRDNLFVLRGGGGNTAVFVRADGVVVVDTKNPGWGQPILDTIKELTNRPVTTIINTHTHGDHVSGNVEFPATVDIVTHENTRANMEEMAPASGFAQGQPQQTIFQQNAGRGLSKRTFNDRLTLGSGADLIELLYFGRGHTNGDALVVFPALRVMHAGDLFSGKNLPIIDANNGGSGVEYPETLARVHSSVKNVETIITGHGTQMTMNDLLEYASFNRDFLNAVREAKQAGRTAEDFVSTWKIPEKYVGYAAPQPARLTSNAQTVFKELP
jgi:glyoxylase-like metal-dependent hydrolase (beta-lactamase superfamily II)